MTNRTDATCWRDCWRKPGREVIHRRGRGGGPAGAADINPVSVLVSDVGMPGLDGYEFMRRVRSLRHASNRVPAIALTAYARAEDRERSLAAGFQRHVSKPYSVSELAATIATLWRDSTPALAS